MSRRIQVGGGRLLAAVIFLGLLAPAGASAAAPAVTNGPAANVSQSSATLTGKVDPNGSQTTYFFEYGLDPSLRPPGASTALYDQSTAPQTLPGDSSTHAVSAPVSGLVPNALYHVRLVARNASGTTFGPDQTFTTPPGPPAPPPVILAP